MSHRFLIPLAAVLSIGAAAPSLAAGSEDGFKTALAAAETANKEAAALKYQWTTTSKTIDAAKKSAAAGDFDKATDLARHAEELAKASIAQAHEQDNAWKDAVIR